MQYIKLNNGLEIPQIGFGLLRLDKDEASEVVYNAIKAGYRHFDSAAGYYNEKEVGLGFKRAFDDGLVKRQDLWITSKIRDSKQGYKSAKVEYQKSLDDLQLDYLDMYMIHWPVPSQNLYIETWKTFEELYNDNKVRSIAVSNFLEPYLDNLLKNCQIKPAVNQLEIHPSFQQKETVKYTKSHNIAIEAYSPIARGKDLGNAEVINIASSLSQQNNVNITDAQIILRWHIQKGHIIIPKTVNPQRMLENLNVFNFELNSQQMLILDALNSLDGSMGHDPHTYSYS